MIDRRTVVAGTLAAATAAALTSPAGAAPRVRKFPKGFLWGAATAGHQIEGNNVASDYWLLENVKPTIFAERSGDACDSFSRFEEDADIAARLNFNCLRLSLEWARIEPEPGAFSIAALDHYARVLTALRKRGLAPIVTFNHFALPRWFAARGGFEMADAPQLFARYVEVATKRLGTLIHSAATFNQPNLIPMVFWRKQLTKDIPGIVPMVAAAAKATGSDRFVSYLLGDQARMQPILHQAHFEAMRAAKSVRSDLPIGVTLIMQDDEGPSELVAERRRIGYEDWLDTANKSDFLGAQIYTRARIGPQGELPPAAGVERTQMGYEFYPRVLGPVVRYAASKISKPIYITENGVGTEDDTRRIAYIDGALDELHGCLEAGIDVRGYMHWSLLDNYEWMYGYRPKFGLVAVDRKTFVRTPKPSALHLAAIARRNAI